MSVYPMKGVIDMHVHTNPDLRLRAYDDLELTDAAVKVGARAIVIKTHQGTTMDRAYLCNRYNKIVHGDKDFTMFGSITLNHPVGGLNPAALEVALKLVVTHPEWWVVDMSIEDQKRIVKDYDVLLERCYAQNMGGGKYKSNLPENLEVIREVGYKNVLISTDGGQTENPHWEIAMQQYLQYLSDHGVPDDQIYYMSHTIAAGLLGIE